MTENARFIADAALRTDEYRPFAHEQDRHCHRQYAFPQRGGEPGTPDARAGRHHERKQIDAAAAGAVQPHAEEG